MNIIDLATKTLQTAIKSVVDAIKTVVDSTKTKVESIDTRTTTISTNVNTANTNLNTLLAGRVVKSVQRGLITTTTNTTGYTVNLATIKPEKSSVSLQGYANPSNSSLPTVDSLTSNQLVINGSLVTSTKIYWEVVEFY